MNNTNIIVSFTDPNDTELVASVWINVKNQVVATFRDTGCDVVIEHRTWNAGSLSTGQIELAIAYAKKITNQPKEVL